MTNNIAENGFSLKRLARLTLLALLACLLVTSTQAQNARPRSAPARQRTTPKAQPLTAAQKAAIAQLIEGGKRAEFSLNYESGQFADSAMRACALNNDETVPMPVGAIRNVIVGMCQAYSDAGHVYARVTHTGLLGIEGVFLENNPHSVDPLPKILERYGQQRATPYQAVGFILGVAVKYREILQVMLASAPTVREQAFSLPPEVSLTSTENDKPILEEAEELDTVGGKLKVIDDEKAGSFAVTLNDKVVHKTDYPTPRIHQHFNMGDVDVALVSGTYGGSHSGTRFWVLTIRKDGSVTVSPVGNLAYPKVTKQGDTIVMRFPAISNTTEGSFPAGTWIWQAGKVAKLTGQARKRSP
jgi:hypothetical protein